MKRYHTNTKPDGRVKITPHTQGCLTLLRELAPAQDAEWTGPDEETKDVLVTTAFHAASITHLLDEAGFGK